MKLREIDKTLLKKNFIIHNYNKVYDNKNNIERICK